MNGGPGGRHGQARTHGHAPGHDGARPHAAQADADARWLAAAGALIVAFMCGEIIAGLAAHSLALLSDAAHMLTDAASVGLALATMKVAARPPHGGYTYGLRRLEILSAQANGITLVLLAAWLGYAAVRRLITPHPVTGSLMLVVALVGVAVNLAATAAMARARGPSPAPAHRQRHGSTTQPAPGGQPAPRAQPGPGGQPGQPADDAAHAAPARRRSLNVEGAFAHVVTDLYAFAATAVAAVIVLTTGFSRADPIATLVVVVLMLRAGAGLIRASGRIFLEAAPAGLDPAEVGTAMAARPCVAEVHDLHVWEITSGMPAASAHVLVALGEDCHRVRADLETLLARYGITHATLQVDHVPQRAGGGSTGGSTDGGTDGGTDASANGGEDDHAGAPGTAPRPGGTEPHCGDAHGPRYLPGATEGH